MKKFLFLATLFIFNNVEAAICTTRSSSNCQTVKGFLIEQRDGCASPKTNCRRVFCESVCAPCPTANDVRTLCYNNCTSINFNDGGVINGKMQGCFGEVAAPFRDFTEEERTIAKQMPALIEKYKQLVKTREQHYFRAQLVDAEATKVMQQIIANAQTIYSTDPARGQTIAQNLLTILATQIQQEEGTYVAPTPTAATPTAAAPQTLSKRASRRLARQASGY